jgi:hypothetical protein
VGGVRRGGGLSTTTLETAPQSQKRHGELERSAPRMQAPEALRIQPKSSLRVASNQFSSYGRVLHVVTRFVGAFDVETLRQTGLAVCRWIVPCAPGEVVEIGAR